ncbi:unnamed protein product [Effrenium voratum]|uniref:S1 motif domain-containing protein n=1 Tax=Effrenium voratum TaxID=2562239 RepID=A0AA36N188_9DINO|nr:unnamed protein product [Effrenium voratum]
MGSIVSGTVTNSSATFGVYVNFGCEKDGKLSVPLADWKKYRVGDRVERMVVNKVNVERKFVDLLVVGSKGQSVGLEASKQAGVFVWSFGCSFVFPFCLFFLLFLLFFLFVFFLLFPIPSVLVFFFFSFLSFFYSFVFLFCFLVFFCPSFFFVVFLLSFFY